MPKFYNCLSGETPKNIIVILDILNFIQSVKLKFDSLIELAVLGMKLGPRFWISMKYWLVLITFPWAKSTSRVEIDRVSSSISVKTGGAGSLDKDKLSRTEHLKIWTFKNPNTKIYESKIPRPRRIYCFLSKTLILTYRPLVPFGRVGWFWPITVVF